MQESVLIPVAFFFMIGWIATMASVNIRKSKAANAVAGLHARVLDKCSSSQDMIAYLESKAGRAFLQQAGTEHGYPLHRILSSLQWGCILLCAGIALLVMRHGGFEYGAAHVLLLAGGLSVALGAGFVFAAGASYALCQNWGLTRADFSRN